MPPKQNKSTKTTLIHNYLQQTQTCHTLKDLEKALPSVASINGMQVKEYVQALADENMVRVEKIGSGNWYWSFCGDVVREKRERLEGMKREVERVRNGVGEVEGRLGGLRERRAVEEGREEGVGEDMEEKREALVRAKAELEKEVGMLRARLMQMERGPGRSVAGMKREIGEFQGQAAQWTDNVYVLEGFVRKLAGGDGELVRAVQMECYGDEYVEGEGLRELGGVIGVRSARGPG